MKMHMRMLVRINVMAATRQRMMKVAEDELGCRARFCSFNFYVKLLSFSVLSNFGVAVIQYSKLKLPAESSLL